jgi:hypothetical protein
MEKREGRGLHFFYRLVHGRTSQWVAGEAMRGYLNPD